MARINKATPTSRDPDRDSFFRWKVQIDIAETWVADGYEIDADALRDLIENQIGFALPSEIEVKVTSEPPREQIRKAQGY